MVDIQNRKSFPELEALLGANVAFYRKTSDLTMEEVAKQLAITYQQYQKNEKGVNRLPATRLYLLSQVLETPIPAFYAGFPEFNDTLTIPPLSPEAIELLRVFHKIENPKVRKTAIAILKQLQK